jgi:hypothetical protein
MKLDPVDRLLKINEAMYYLLEEPPTPQKKVFGDPEVVARVTSNMQSSPSSSPAPTQSSAPKSGQTPKYTVDLKPVRVAKILKQG